MIVFLCAHVRISISTYILTSIVIYLPHRLTSSDVTRRCVFVYGGLKNINVFVQRLLTVFVTFFTFFNVFFIFFLELFYIYGAPLTPKIAPLSYVTTTNLVVPLYS